MSYYFQGEEYESEWGNRKERGLLIGPDLIGSDHLISIVQSFTSSAHLFKLYGIVSWSNIFIYMSKGVQNIKHVYLIFRSFIGLSNEQRKKGEITNNTVTTTLIHNRANNNIFSS